MFEVGVINYGVGNIVNVIQALKYLEINTLEITNKREFEKCRKLILPGVGAFDYGIQQLHVRDLFETILRKAKVGTPILGICLGMQLMFERSEESNTNLEGLSLLSGQIVRLRPINNFRVPRIGWFETFDNLTDSENSRRNLSFLYYAHSYFATAEENLVFQTTQHNKQSIPAGVKKYNVSGVQYHPEKSGKNGLRLLKNFAENL